MVSNGGDQVGTWKHRLAANPTFSLAELDSNFLGMEDEGDGDTPIPYSWESIDQFEDLDKFFESQAWTTFPQVSLDDASGVPKDQDVGEVANENTKPCITMPLRQYQSKNSELHVTFPDQGYQFREPAAHCTVDDPNLLRRQSFVEEGLHSEKAQQNILQDSDPLWSEELTIDLSPSFKSYLSAFEKETLAQHHQPAEDTSMFSPFLPSTTFDLQSSPPVTKTCPLETNGNKFHHSTPFFSLPFSSVGHEWSISTELASSCSKQVSEVVHPRDQQQSLSDSSVTLSKNGANIGGSRCLLSCPEYQACIPTKRSAQSVFQGNSLVDDYSFEQHVLGYHETNTETRPRKRMFTKQETIILNEGDDEVCSSLQSPKFIADADHSGLEVVKPTPNFGSRGGGTSDVALFKCMEDAVLKLDFGTRIGMRDALYRLARSSSGGHVKNEDENSTRTDDAKFRMRLAESGSVETPTNAIDRVIVSLLFYRQSFPQSNI